MSIKTTNSAWRSGKQRKRPASESCIDDPLHSLSKKPKTSPDGKPDWIKFNQLADHRHIGYSASSISSSTSALSDRRRNASEQIPDDEVPPRQQRFNPDRNDLSQQDTPPAAFIAPLTRQALHHFNNANRSSYSEASPSMSTEVRSELLESLAPEEPSGTISAYHPNYISALEDRGVFFADDEDDNIPSNLTELTGAVMASRDSPEPDDGAARTLRILMNQAPNESAIVQSILPKIVPIEELSVDKKTSTAPEQLWHRKIMIKPRAKPTLATIKPDRTIGWFRRVFEYPSALKYLEARACPVATNSRLAFPLFTVEVKGDKGTLRVAKLQNLHNAATMLSNLLHTRQFYKNGDTDGFFNKVHVITLELTADIIHLSCYWATRSESGDVQYYGMRLRSWTPYEDSQYREARRCTRNALEWVKAQSLGWICIAMENIEKGLLKGSLSPSAPMLPPTQSTPIDTQSDQSSIKRKVSLASASQSSSTPTKRRSNAMS